MRYSFSWVWIVGLIPLLTACPVRPPFVETDDIGGPDCQSIKVVTVTPPCTNAYPGLILTASRYDRRGRDSQFEWRIYIQRDTSSTDTTALNAKVFSGNDRILILDTVFKDAPKFIVSIVPSYWRCTKHNYFSLVKQSTSNSACPVWTSRKIQ